MIKPFSVLALALAVVASACSSTPQRAEASLGRVIEFKSDASGFDTRTFFYEGSQEVVAFDAQFTPELARQSIRHLRQFTQKPIKWLVITHPNPDKYNGASVFQAEGATIVASQATSQAIPEVHAVKEQIFVERFKMFKKGEYPQPVEVDLTFAKTKTLALRGGDRIELRELSAPGVSRNQTVAYIEPAAALFVGDLIHHKAHAWLEGGIVKKQAVPTLDGWMADLKELRSFYPDATQVYGGRGVTTNLQKAVADQIAYLKAARELVRAELKALGAQAKAEFTGARAGERYKALASRFQAAYPDYDLSYLIEYGAYGLVESELQNLD